MNYRHAYHAGNFADVVKHAVLARVLTYMKLKPQPFRIIDSHAGAGRYDLAGVEAGKTAEWRDGIGRVLDTAFAPGVAALLAPYLEAVRAVNAATNAPSEGLRFYPGSPLIAAHLMRATDTLIANELHPDDAGLLRAEFSRARNVKVMTRDGWTALKALLPPKERRGVILIDPPFEARDEFAALRDGLSEALARFATGTFVVWYPVKAVTEADGFVNGVMARPGIKALDVRLRICTAFPGLGLTETGLLLVNPPFSLAGELQALLPALSDCLAEGTGAGFSLRSS